MRYEEMRSWRVGLFSCPSLTKYVRDHVVPTNIVMGRANYILFCGRVDTINLIIYFSHTHSSTAYFHSSFQFQSIIKISSFSTSPILYIQQQQQQQLHFSIKSNQINPPYSSFD
ncbi:hypothetical protein QVD17_27296 [Tagetes erecta]|uniref:Uncharacterized protein n=1 Tax=Tagetes erecta TaxID=13708 RepID=A0AAD8NR54_TARER|nr:hypothetical protein QVD17_27296 [Tagetes erecta]